MAEPTPESKADSRWWAASRWLDWRAPLKLILLTGVIVGIAMGLFVVAGGVNVSADRPDGWLVRNLLHFTFKRSESAQASTVTPPSDLSAASRVKLAAQHFDMVCSNCHGRPGFGQSVIALSMNPRPQYLPSVVGQFTDSELFEIVDHGVKYSAMPSWPTQARDDEVWSMVAFLRQLPKMDAKTYRDMTALPQNVNAALGDSAADSTLRPADAWRDTPPVNEFVYAAPASGFSDQSVHENPAATCARCHGADGSGAATAGEAPNLTIQGPAYLRAALEAFIRGGRKSGFMQNIAAQLSGAQVVALANYYAGLPVKSVSSAPADPALVARGQAIATQGLRERAIPACGMCHESAGGALIGAPHIAGQSATFLRRELGAMRLGGRGSTVWWNPMPAEAHELGDTDIAAVAAYYSGLTPAKAAGGQAPGQTPPATVGAKGDMAAGQHIFATRCATCHGHAARGDLAGGFPDLTLQSKPYLAQSLYSFRTGVRPNAKMRYVIDTISFDDMTSVADYLDSLQAQPALARPVSAATSRGAVIASRGIAAQGVPACLGCHGEKGVAALPLVPRLQGQSELYLRARLNNFATAYNVDLTALDPMPSIAGKLTRQQRADLAAYFAATAPLQKSARR